MKNRGVYLLLGVLALFGIFVYFNFSNSSIETLTGYALYGVDTASGFNHLSLTGCLFYINGSDDSCQLLVANSNHTIEGTWLPNITNYNLTGAELAYEFDGLTGLFSGNLTNDSSVLANTGTLCGSIGCNYSQNFSLANRTLNIRSTALMFDGKSAFINSSVSTAALGGSDFTIVAWINATSYEHCLNGTCVIVAQTNVSWTGANASSSGIMLYVNNNTGKVTCANLNNGVDTGNTTSVNALTKNKIYHVACVGNASKNMSLYVDGDFINSSSYTGGNNNGTVHIGGTNRMFNNTYFNGSIDSVVVWNRSLNSSEIRDLAYGRLETYYIMNSYTGTTYSVILPGVSNVNINCKGATFVGNGTDAVFADYSAVQSGNISNCIISNFSGATSVGVIMLSNFGGLYNNTIQNATEPGAIAISASMNNFNISQNTIKDSQNGILVAGNPAKNVTIINNSFINISGYGIKLNTCANCSILNNTFDNVSGANPIRIVSADNNRGINISLNTFRNINSSTNSTFVGVGAGELIRIWNNNYYSNSGVQFVKTINNITNFCVGNIGNFYNENIPVGRRGNGTAGSDCGLMNITSPDGGEILINDTHTINWTRQSSARTITYYIYYSNDSGVTYRLFDSTTNLNYSWKINNSLIESSNYYIKIVPLAESVNGTNDVSTNNFTVDPNNPTVALTQSASGLLNLGEARTFTCTVSDTIGISTMSMTIDGKSCSGTSSCNIVYVAATTGDKTATCSASDISGRSKSTSLTVSIVSSAGGTGSGGGGGSGGSGTIAEPIAEVTPAETVDVTSVTGSTSLSVNENANVVINGIQSSLTVTSVSASSATATIAGETITLNVGQSQDVDLNDDGVKDVKVTLAGIINGEAKFEIQKAEARIAAEAALEQTKKEAAITAVKKPKFNLAYIIGLAGLVLILGIVMLIHHYRHGRHKK